VILSSGAARPVYGGSIHPAAVPPKVSETMKPTAHREKSLVAAIEVAVGGWRIIFDAAVKRAMRTHRSPRLPNETRGVLLGAFDLERKLVFVSDATASILVCEFPACFQPKALQNRYSERSPVGLFALRVTPELDPVPQFKATAKVGEFLEARFSQSFSLCGAVSGANRS